MGRSGSADPGSADPCGPTENLFELHHDPKSSFAKFHDCSLTVFPKNQNNQKLRMKRFAGRQSEITVAQTFIVGTAIIELPTSK